MPPALNREIQHNLPDHNYVSCQVCGAQGLDLRKHIRRHALDEVEYLARYPCAPLIAEKLRPLLTRNRNPRPDRPSGPVAIGEVLPDAIRELVSEGIPHEGGDHP